jgi:DNA-directed RNA polymerase specialized sigma24 family protein
VDLTRACADLIAAARGDGDAGATLRRVESEVRAAVLALARNKGRLCDRAHVAPEDVAQHVLERLLTSPPRNPAGRDPVACVFAWTRVVAVNFLLDRIEAGAPGNDETPVVDDGPSVEEQLDIHRKRAELRAVAPALKAYKYLYEVYEVLFEEDAEISALDLAVRIGLVDAGADPEALRKATTYAWKLRERTTERLTELVEMRKRARESRR